MKDVLLIFKDLSDSGKGLFLMLAGFILLLHTLGIMQRGLDLIIIIASLYIIVYGFIKAKYHQKILVLIKKK